RRGRQPVLAGALDLGFQTPHGAAEMDDERMVGVAQRPAGRSADVLAVQEELHARPAGPGQEGAGRKFRRVRGPLRPRRYRRRFRQSDGHLESVPRLGEANIIAPIIRYEAKAMTDHSLEGKVALIAGGAKNLGGLIARDFASHGAAAVAIHYNSAGTRPAAEETAAAVRSAGAEAILFQADLTRPDNVAALFDRTLEAFGRADIAINTVGMVLKKPLVEVSEAEYDTMVASNVEERCFFAHQSD